MSLVTVDLSDEALEALKRLRDQRNDETEKTGGNFVSRADLVREAVDQFVANSSRSGGEE